MAKIRTIRTFISKDGKISHAILQSNGLYHFYDMENKRTLYENKKLEKVILYGIVLLDENIDNIVIRLSDILK